MPNNLTKQEIFDLKVLSFHLIEIGLKETAENISERAEIMQRLAPVLYGEDTKNVLNQVLKDVFKSMMEDMFNEQESLNN